MAKPEHGSPYPEDHTLAMALTASYTIALVQRALSVMLLQPALT